MFRRKFTKELKEAAVRKVIRGASAPKVAHACRVDTAVLRRWQKEFEELGAKAFGGYRKSRQASAAPNRQKFTKQFKEAAVRKLRRGTPEREVARGCRVNPWILRRWQKEFEEFGTRAFGGYGKNRHARAGPRSRVILLCLSSDELDAVKMASSAGGFRSLAEFARSRIFHPANETSLVQVQDILEELAIVVRKLTQTLAKE